MTETKLKQLSADYSYGRLKFRHYRLLRAQCISELAGEICDAVDSTEPDQYGAVTDKTRPRSSNAIQSSEQNSSSTIIKFIVPGIVALAILGFLFLSLDNGGQDQEFGRNSIAASAGGMLNQIALQIQQEQIWTSDTIAAFSTAWSDSSSQDREAFIESGSYEVLKLSIEQELLSRQAEDTDTQIESGKELIELRTIAKALGVTVVILPAEPEQTTQPSQQTQSAGENGDLESELRQKQSLQDDVLMEELLQEKMLEEELFQEDLL